MSTKYWVLANFFDEFAAARACISLAHEPHPECKLRVPRAIGLIRTADTIPYANVILESA